MPASKKTSAGKPANARPKAPTARAKGPAATPAPVLADVRAQIDGIDRRIQELIAQRAGFALQVGKAKGVAHRLVGDLAKVDVEAMGKVDIVLAGLLPALVGERQGKGQRCVVECEG